jgi:hypothetical protein
MFKPLLNLTFFARLIDLKNHHICLNSTLLICITKLLVPAAIIFHYESFEGAAELFYVLPQWLRESCHLHHLLASSPIGVLQTESEKFKLFYPASVGLC